MNNNVHLEKELYPPMQNWLQEHLEDKYQECTIHTYDTDEISLDNALALHNFPVDKKLVGIPIQIDVLGVIEANDGHIDLAFIEAKKTPLNIHALGQLLVYCRIANPVEAFLLSSGGMGNLSKILINQKRQDILKYGPKNERSIFVANWNVAAARPDMETMVFST